MAATLFPGGGACPLSLSRTIERVLEDAHHTGNINLNGRKLRGFPKIAPKYDLADTIIADLSKNCFSEIPTEIFEYTSLEKLNCYHNVIKSIPDALVQLQGLTYLNLSRNQLLVIPAFISQLQALEVLIASHNKLVSLPEEIGFLDKLLELDISCNEISQLPPQTGDLKSLRSLNVRRNLLLELPVELCKLHLRRFDFSSNKISKIPTVFRKIETMEEIILEYNPLTVPPAHICMKGRRHIMKYLQIEALREDRKLNMLNESEMKRLVRKSLPPGQSISSEEFRNIIESPEGRWKRHTVLSSDSGYSTTESIEKCGRSPPEELQRQKSDYERRKKQAEQIRRHHEDEEREERRKAALHVQEEQRVLLDKQRDEFRMREEARQKEEAKVREDVQLQEVLKLREDESLKEAARLRAEEEVRAAEKSQQQEVEQKRLETRKPGQAQQARGENKKGKVAQLVSSFSTSFNWHDVYSHHFEENMVDSCGMYYRKPASSSLGIREECRAGTSTQYNRRTVSDSAKRMQTYQSTKSTVMATTHQNGIAEDGQSTSGSSTPLASPGLSPNASHSSMPNSPAHHPPSSRTTLSEKSSPQHTSGVVRRTKPPDRLSTGRGAMTVDRHGRATTASTVARTATGTNKKNQIASDEEFKMRHKAMKTTQQQEAQRLKSRLTQPQKVAGQGVASPRPGASGDGERKARNNMYNSATSKRSGTVLSASTMKILEQYKDANPNFTIRRDHVQHREEVEQIEHLRKTIELRLKITLPDNVPAALRDGVVLCHLANQIRPRAVASIHVPSPAVPKLTIIKCRRNVENFLEACRKIGVNQEQVCGSVDVLEERGTPRVALTVAALIAIAANPKQSAV